LNPPTILGLTYTPTVVYVNASGGQAIVTGGFTFNGANGGVLSVTISVTNAAGSVVATTTTPVTGGANVSSGQLQGQVVVGTGTVGAYTVHATLTDMRGLVSNALTGPFQIAPSPWALKTPMPTTRRSFATAKSGGLAYLIGGEVPVAGPLPGASLALVEAYDPASDTWSSISPMPTARRAAAAATVNGVIYVFGGSGGVDLLATVEAFDTTTGMWSTRAPMPTPRRAAAATAVGSVICVFGGVGATGDLATTECYDPTTDKWTGALAAMPTMRDSLAAITVGATAYAIGGNNFVGGGTVGVGPVAAVESYDLASNTWATLTWFSTRRQGLGVVFVDNKVLAIGGEAITPIATIEAYDFSRGFATFKTDMPLPLTSVGAVEIGGLVYVFEQEHTLSYTPALDIL
jgi:hypothetical protein